MERVCEDPCLKFNVIIATKFDVILQADLIERKI